MRSLIFTMLLGLCACASADALYRPSVSDGRADRGV